MGLLDDLLKQLQEAAEQQRRTTLPGTPRSPRAEPPRERAAEWRAEQRRQAAQQAQTPVDDEPRPMRTTVDSLPAQVVSGRDRGITHPLLDRLRAPGGAREALVLSEILRRPDFRWRRPRG